MIIYISFITVNTICLCKLKMTNIISLKSENASLFQKNQNQNCTCVQIDRIQVSLKIVWYIIISMACC